MKILLGFLALLAFTMSVNATSRCDNLACGTHCIDDGDVARCACDCSYQFEESSNNKCVGTRTCKQEILFFVNFGASIDQMDCILGDTDQNNFPKYQADLVRVLDMIKGGKTSATGEQIQFNVAVVNYASTGLTEIIKPYTTGTIQQAIDWYNGRTQPYCDASNPFTGVLYRMVGKGETILVGPTDFHVRDENLSYHVIVAAPYLEDDLDFSVAQSLHELVDGLVILNYETPMNLEPSDEEKETYAKLSKKLGCKDPEVEKCSDVFYFDKDNHYGKPLNNKNLFEQFHLDACNKRTPKDPIELTSGADGALSVTISTCQLLTMKCGDLKFENYDGVSMCYFASDVAKGMKIMVPLLGANTKIEASNNGAKVSNKIVPAHGAGKHYPQIKYEFERTFTVTPYSYAYKKSFKRVTENGEFFGTEFKIFKEETLETELTDTSGKIAVGSDIYLHMVSTDLPAELTSKVWKLYCSDSVDETKVFLIYSDGEPHYCASCTVIEGQPKNTNLVKDLMFEMSSTVFKTDDEKDPVVFRLEVVQCADEDTHDYCAEPKYKRRKRRSLDELEMDKHEQNENKKNYVDVKIAEKVITNYRGVEKRESMTMGTNILFLILFTLVGNYLVAKCKEREASTPGEFSKVAL